MRSTSSVITRALHTVLRARSSVAHSQFAARILSRSNRCYATKVPTAGQPIPRTHPHLLNEGDIVVGQNAREFERRRARFVSKMSTPSIAVIPAHYQKMMSHDIPYTFRQNTNFAYLTGFLEPEAVAVMVKYSEKEYEYILFVRPKDARKEMWDGPRTGVDQAKLLFKPSRCFDIAELDSFLTKLANNSHQFSWNSLYCDWEDAALTPIACLEAVLKPQPVAAATTNCKGAEITANNAGPVISRLAKLPDFHIRNLVHIFDELRLNKSAVDAEMLRRTAHISSEAFRAAMQATRPGISEGHVEAHLEFEVRVRGAQRLAYPPVVAAGNNANTLHYVANNQILKDGDLLLVDAGAEYHLYSSDITRTWPVNGKFSDAQRDIYQAVLNIQKKMIKLCEPYQMSMTQLNRYATFAIAEELVSLGIAPASMSVQKVIDSKFYQHFYPHSIGHYVGMDIHEGGNESQAMLPGMTVTVEPGIYIPIDTDIPVPERYRGIGIRIEDNILITNDGHENLTAAVPKEIADIEALMATHSSNPVAKYMHEQCSV